jgi:hypothetical protein
VPTFAEAAIILGVIPAKAGTQAAAAQMGSWVPAFAGMTLVGGAAAYTLFD